MGGIRGAAMWPSSRGPVNTASPASKPYVGGSKNRIQRIIRMRFYGCFFALLAVDELVYVLDGLVQRAHLAVIDV